MKFLVSALGQMGLKISDCKLMLVLCQILHICTYNRPNFSGNWPPFGDLSPPKLQVLEPPRNLMRAKAYAPITHGNSKRNKAVIKLENAWQSIARLA